MSDDVYAAGFDAMVTRMHADLHNHDDCVGCRVAAGALTPAVIDAVRPLIEADLRERIAQRIDQAWAEANDRRPRSEYRDGYLDGLEHAEAVARITPLTIGVAPLDVEAPQYDRIESRGRKS